MDDFTVEAFVATSVVHSVGEGDDAGSTPASSPRQAMDIDR